MWAVYNTSDGSFPLFFLFFFWLSQDFNPRQEELTYYSLSVLDQLEVWVAVYAAGRATMSYSR